MIYESVSNKAPLNQGDIFVDLPFAQIRMVDMVRYESNLVVQNWKEITKESFDDVNILIKVSKKNCILISQNCDASNASDLTFSPFVEFSEVLSGQLPPDKEKHNKWIGERLPRFLRENPRFFYLPASGAYPFESKYLVDLRVTFTLKKHEILQYINLRKCCLNDAACEHFRETISQYYRRYAYNEWYPLNKCELDSYRKNNPIADEDIYEWQR